MSDVSAVVLSIGEPYTRRAIESLAAQTIPPEEVIVIENVSPFFRAINEGARRVRTPFFVQVDADMVLDPNCIEVLRRDVRDDTGIVVGELRDPLAGQAVGVKLLRTECFRRLAMPDSISPDTDFGARLRRLGWRTEYVRAADDRSKPRLTLGEHRPDYTPSYTYRKMLIEGARLVHRSARHGLFSRMADLERSGHPLAVLARVALAHGLFLPLKQDELKPAADDPRAEWLAAFLAADGVSDGLITDLFPLDRHARLRDVYRLFLSAGRQLAQANAGATFRKIVATLERSGRDLPAIVGRVAVAHGVLITQADRTDFERDEHLVHHFVVFGLGSDDGRRDDLRARAKRLLSRVRRSGSSVRW